MPELTQLPVTDVLDRLSAADDDSGGSSAAAVACALAASLVAGVTRDDQTALGVTRLARSSAMRDRVLSLAGSRQGTDDAVATVRNALAIASAAAQLTSLAAESAVGASDAAVTDAIVAAELADGACRAAVHIVRIGLRDAPTDPRRTEAAGLVASSALALDEAFAEAAERASAA
jgi:hypothetical protein